jgi:hypothetical protein
MVPKAAFRIGHIVHGRDEYQVGSGQQRGLTYLASDLHSQAGVQCLATASQRCHESPALGNSHVNRCTGVFVNQGLQGSTITQALVDHDFEALGLPH